MPGRTPFAALPYGNNIQYPTVQANGGVNSENQPPARSDAAAADSKSVISSSPAIARGDQSAVESTTEEDQIS
jgi:hypothetical protein